jgi:hypothetical protein
MLERVYRGEIAILKEIKSQQTTLERRETLSGKISSRQQTL